MVGGVGRIRKGGKDGMERMGEDEGTKGGDNEKDGWGRCGGRDGKDEGDREKDREDREGRGGEGGENYTWQMSAT